MRQCPNKFDNVVDVGFVVSNDVLVGCCTIAAFIFWLWLMFISSSLSSLGDDNIDN